jgi:hypothetical protein
MAPDRAHLASLTVLSLVLRISSASAQTSAGSTSTDPLIQRARAASVAGEHSRAIDLALQAGRAGMTPWLRMFIANEHSALGEWLGVARNAVYCRAEAARIPALSRRDVDILTSCTRLEASAAPHVGHVILRVPESAPGLRLSVVGVEVPPELWGLRFPVNAAAVVVDASAEGGRTFREEFTIAAGQEREVTVRLSPARTPEPTRPAVTQTVTAPHVPPPVVPIPPPATRWWLGPAIVGGLGAATLVTAGVFALLRESARSDRDASTNTESTANAYHRDFQTYTDITNVTLAVGGALVVGSAVWFLLAPRRSSDTRRAMLTPGFTTSGGASLSLRGVW